MAGKNTKNPLLTGASISFPFENFTNSALLVPVTPQNEPALLPEEIEADSFLGQEPPSSNPKPGRTPEHPPPPVFTQSFTGSISPAKPTPIYADALSSQFNRTLAFQPSQSHNNDTLLYPNRETTSDLNLRQPPPTQTSSLFYSNQNTSNSTPSIFTPVFTDSSPSELSTLSPSTAASDSPATQPIFNYFSSEQNQQSNKPPVQLFSPSAPSPSVTNSLAPSSSVSNSSASPSFPNLSAPPPSFPNFSVPTPSITNPLAPPPLISNPSAPPPSITSSSATPFLVSNSSIPSPSVGNPIAPPLPLTNPSAPPSSATNLSTFPFLTSPLGIPSSTPLPTQTSEANATPPLGGAHNSYRLSNIKRPTYTRPPELSVTPMAAMPSPAPPPVAPAPVSTTLFTPCSVDSTDSPVPTLFPSSVPTGTPVSSILPSSIPASTTTSAILPPSVPPTIPTLPPSTSSPAPTILPSSPATVTVTGAAASSYRPPQSLSPNTPSVLPPSFANLAQGTSYRPVYCHWFFKKIVEGKVLWFPFSMNDSLALEQAFTSPTISPDTKVPTDGGRYDVEVLRRRRTAVYWEEDAGEVRRCSWFVKGSMDVRFIPYEENVATMLEEEYRIAATTNEWNRHVSLPDGEMIVIHSPNAIAHHTRSASPDVWGNSPQMQQKPRVVKRGMDEFDISEGEPEKVDHLLFLVHGIGKFCDLKFRPVTEVVDDFRSVSLQLLQSHFKSAVEAGQASRVEVLPVSWHQALHNADIDTRLNNITLQSIPRLRHFTNDTLLDILFYTSPVFCETIVQAVGNELNRLYNLFLSRNPSYQGDVSLGGHSLGSLILFDMLCNQVPVASPSPCEHPSTPTSESQEISGEDEVKTLGCMKAQKARLSRTVSYLTIGNAGTGQPFISYPQLVFKPKAFFALGSPIGMFVTVRGIESLGEDFALPTCPMFFNIFHPFDPVAYRIESLITSDFAKYSPVLIPHHKGRKRMHLELKDTLEHVGTALKQRLIESVRNTWNTVYQLTMFHRTDDQAIEQEVNKVLENEMMQSCGETDRSETPDTCPEPDVKMGQLNGGRRVDYVLQEAPLESFNEYLFALSSHVCYWESEDTMLMMLKEIYGTMGITPDTQVVQQILPYEEPGQYGGGMDPTAPPSDSLSVGPPPISGFIKGQK